METEEAHEARRLAWKQWLPLVLLAACNTPAILIPNPVDYPCGDTTEFECPDAAGCCLNGWICGGENEGIVAPLCPPGRCCQPYDPDGLRRPMAPVR